MSHLDLNLIVLLVLLGCGIFSHNTAVTIAAGVLIVFRITPLSQFFPLLQTHGLEVGIIILTIGVLTPIASGKIPGEEILKSFLSWKSLLAIAVGLLVAWLGVALSPGLLTPEVLHQLAPLCFVLVDALVDAFGAD